MDSLESESITLGIDDAALLLQGMAFTELMSVDLPWFETVQWVTDFVTSELRQHWSDQECLTLTSVRRESFYLSLLQQFQTLTLQHLSHNE